MYAARELILKKRDGFALDRAEIAGFVAGVCDGTVTDAQIAAFAMATWFRGMDPDEQMALTLAMRDSGRVLDWAGLDGPVLDKHSTGGVGDLVSLILAPLVAACGAFVPMISGRGLGHTGGTLDKLESIPGFDTTPGVERFQRLVSEQRLAIVSQSTELVPADKRLYAVRDETSSVSSIPLIVSSILSKKLAEGLDALVLDIKSGCGAFMESPEAARCLAGTICRVASAAGLPCRALVTDMDQPLARSVGNALEVREAIEFLRGDVRDERLNTLVLELSSELLQLGGLAAGPDAARSLATDALDSGQAAQFFGRMVGAQGGPAGLVDSPESFLPVASVIRPVFPQQCGFVERVDTRAVGMVVVGLGGGRQRAADMVDPAVGLSRLCAVGSPVGPDVPISVVHAASEAAWELAAARLRSAIRIGPEPLAGGPVVCARVTGDTRDASI